LEKTLICRFVGWVEV